MIPRPVRQTVQPGKKPAMEHPHAHEDPATARVDAKAQEAEEIHKAAEAHHERTDMHKHS